MMTAPASVPTTASNTMTAAYTGQTEAPSNN